VLQSRIFVFRRVTDGLSVAQDWLSEHVADHGALVLGATRFAADEFARRAPAPGLVGVHSLTLVQLAAMLARPLLADRLLSPLSDLGSGAIAARVAYKLGSANRLSYFGPVVGMPGFSTALASTLSELRLAGVRPESLGGLGPRAEDLGLLLLEYERELATWSLADLSQIFEFATRTALVETHPMLTLPVILLDVPVRSAKHTEFVRALVRRAESVLAIAHACDEAGVLRLESALGAKATSAPAGAFSDDALGRATTYLFSTGRPPEGVYDGSVDLFSAPGEGAEVVEIARRIRQFADSGVPFDQVAVLLRAPERYQGVIEEALGRAGIPAYFSRGTARPDPAGRAFLALLACASEGCSASRFSEYLSLGQTPQLDPAGRPPQVEPEFVPPEDDIFQSSPPGALRPPDSEDESVTIATPIAWERLLVDAAVIGGPARWHRRLKGLEQEFRLQLARLPLEGATRGRIEEQLERLANLERFALPLIDRLAALPKSAPWIDWLAELRRLAAMALRRPRSVLAVINELDPMGAVGGVTLEEVQTVLSHRIRFLRREPPRRRYGHVLVASIEEARGRAFEIVFLPGLAEGVFPRRVFEDAVLLDDLRRCLSPDLRWAEQRVAEERLLLHTCVAAPSKTLVASFPSVDLSQGRPRVPSFYALEIARAIEGRVPNLRTFEARTRAKAEAQVSWPAPSDPARAIDDAEYDLSWYARHATERGSSKYLEEANPFLFESLRNRYRRWERTWSAADGLVRPDAAALALLKSKDPLAHPYSCSSLQHFAACPYRFYLHAILGIHPREEAAPLEQLDPLTRGALFHAIQFRFFQEWRQQPEAATDRLLDVLDAAVDSVAAEYEEKLAPAIPSVWRGDVEDLRTDLRGWMRLWHSRLAEWEPLHFEFAFGLDAVPGERDPASRREGVVLEGVGGLHGSIDMVERHRTRGVLRVVDHKTGKPPEREPVSVGGGAILQPALYALAAEVLLGQAAESSRLDYCTQRGGFRSFDIAIDSPTRMRIERVLATVRHGTTTGFLPAAPREGACRQCDYRAVCGPNEEIRAKRWKPPIDFLTELRNLP